MLPAFCSSYKGFGIWKLKVPAGNFASLAEETPNSKENNQYLASQLERTPTESKTKASEWSWSLL